MRYPCLIQKQVCKTPIKIEIEQEGIDKYGEPLDSITFEGLCNYQDRATTIYTDEKKLIQINGKALIRGDIAPELAVISGGMAIIEGVERKIHSGSKRRNPDGTVNYTEVLLV